MTKEKMKRARFKSITAVIAASAFALTGCAGGSGDVEEETYPNEAITMIVPFGPGGGTDNYMRQMVPIAAEELGVNMEIQNVKGVAGLIGMRELAAAEPDGYTIGAYNPPATNVAEIVEGDDGGVQLRELTPIGSYGIGGWVMIAAADAPVDNLQDVVDAYQSGEFTTIGSEHVGGPTQLIAELMKARWGLDYENYVGYEGGEISAAVLRGEVPIGVLTDSAALTVVESGDAKVIATLYEPGSSFFPEIETAVDQGFEDITFATKLTRVIVGPPGLPEDKVEVLASAFEAAVRDESILAWSEDTGSPVEWGDAAAAQEAVEAAYSLQEELPNMKELLSGG